MENGPSMFIVNEGAKSISQDNVAAGLNESCLMDREDDDMDIYTGISEEQASSKAIHFDKFQTWATQNYGENSKTKTVTRRKYNRIMMILTGEEPPSSDNAKFRFWVKAKGFKLGPSDWKNGMLDTKKVLYVPTKVQTSHGTRKEYKRVAIVGDFFDIIYSMHVDSDSRGGKHAGQKRTYRAIAETYAFLPREAVTRFLMSCTDCQKRMYLSMEADGKIVNTSGMASPPDAKSQQKHMFKPVKKQDSETLFSLPIGSQDVNYNIPITTTYLNEMKRWKLSREANVSPWYYGERDKPSSRLPPQSLAHLTNHSDAPTITSQPGNNDLETSPERDLKKRLTGSIAHILSEENSHVTDPVKLHTQEAPDLQIDPTAASVASSQANSPAKPESRNESNSPETCNYSMKAQDSWQNTLSKSRPHPPTGSTTSMLDRLLYVQRNLPVPAMPNSPTGTQLAGANEYTTKDEPKDLSMKSQRSSIAVLSEDEETQRYQELSLATKSYSTLMPQSALTYFQHSKTLSIQQMITGYRESAAFLYRSAEELERLLLAYS